MMDENKEYWSMRFKRQCFNFDLKSTITNNACSNFNPSPRKKRNDPVSNVPIVHFVEKQFPFYALIFRDVHVGPAAPPRGPPSAVHFDWLFSGRFRSEANLGAAAAAAAAAGTGAEK